jgi:DNA-binding HxlR family transcriptional regulator
LSFVPGSSKKARSGCPVSLSLEILGDRWSLLVIRDLMVRGLRTFREFRESGEGIATNILADRLQRLEAAGVVESEAAESDARSVHYRLTEKGIDLAPLLLDLLLWGARHRESAAPEVVLRKIAADRDGFLAEVRRRWETRDPNPILPPFPARKRTTKPKSRSGNTGPESHSAAVFRAERDREAQTRDGDTRRKPLLPPLPARKRATGRKSRGAMNE